MLKNIFCRTTPLILGLVACAGGGKDSTPATTDSGTTDLTSTETCVSGETWTGGNEESPLMHPGMDCIACHDQGEGPTFEVAGTVYSVLGQPDDCYGESGVEVEITDADGAVFSATTNAAGNFYLKPSEADITYPYTVRILIDGEEVNRMSAPQDDGACGSCHGQTGSDGAPGRVTTG